MLEGFSLFMLGIALILFIVVIATVIDSYRRWGIARRLPAEEKAFEEQIAVPPDLRQLDRLRPLIDRVGILRVPSQVGRRAEALENVYEVWVLDSLGTIHDVRRSFDRAASIDLAVRIADYLDVELETRDVEVDRAARE